MQHFAFVGMAPRAPRLGAIVIAGFVLAACGGGGGGNNGPAGIACNSVSGGGTQISFSQTCTGGGGCRAINQNAAKDGDSGSKATITVDTGTGGTVSLRVTAQTGVVYPAGTPAGLIYGPMAEGQHTSQTFMVRTYLGGSPTGDSGSVGPTNGVGGSASTFDPRKASIGTSTQFDAIEFSYTQSNGTGPINLDVYEFCTD